MILLDNVSKIYSSGGGEVRALDGLSLQVDEGEFLAVIGSSGSGKSTLLSLIGGLTRPSQGRVTVFRNDLTAMSSAELAQLRADEIGFVFQMFHLLPYLDVLQNVLLATSAAANGETLQRGKQLLDELGLSDRLTHRPGQLSAGERQRTAMARALLNRPRLLLADEPTGNLDPESAAVILQHVDDFHQQGGTVILVTHDREAAAYANRTITLRAGRLEENADAGKSAT